VDAPREIPQFGQGVLGVLVGRADQREHVVARGQVLLDLAQGHGQRGQPDLGPVVQVTLDPTQPGRRPIDGPGARFLQLAGSLGHGETVFERDVVGAPVGHGVAQDPGGEHRGAQPGAGQQQQSPGISGVHRSPAADRDGRAEQADGQARQRDPARPVGGQGIEQHGDGQVGHGRLERAHRRDAAAWLHSEGELRGPEQRGRGERGHRGAPAHDHGGRHQHVDRERGQRRAER
jgi:hypothetical protein